MWYKPPQYREEAGLWTPDCEQACLKAGELGTRQGLASKGQQTALELYGLLVVGPSSLGVLERSCHPVQDGNFVA